MGLQRLGGRVLRVQCLYEGKKRLRVARGEAFERMADEHQLGMLPDAHGQAARLGLRTVLAYPRVGAGVRKAGDERLLRVVEQGRSAE